MRYLSSRGSEPTAACGGRKEASEWQRSARCKPASSGAAAAGHRNRSVARQVLSAYMCLTSVFGMGSEPTAACGGRKEASEWQRSARCKPASSGAATAGHRNRMTSPSAAGGGNSEGAACAAVCVQHRRSSPRRTQGTANGNRWTIINKEKPHTFVCGLCWHYLSSRAVARQVVSAQMSLTSVFGMGTGGPSLQSIPTFMVTHTGFEPMLTA